MRLCYCDLGKYITFKVGDFYHLFLKKKTVKKVCRISGNFAENPKLLRISGNFSINFTEICSGALFSIF